MDVAINGGTTKGSRAAGKAAVDVVVIEGVSKTGGVTSVSIAAPIVPGGAKLCAGGKTKGGVLAPGTGNDRGDGIMMSWVLFGMEIVARTGEGGAEPGEGGVELSEKRRVEQSRGSINDILFVVWGSAGERSVTGALASGSPVNARVSEVLQDACA